MNIEQTVVFAGPVQSRSGYGARARDIAHALIQLGVNLRIVSLRWGVTPMTALDPNNEKDRLILSKIQEGPVDPKPDIFIHCTIPNEFQVAGRFNIGITAGIETTLCRPEWIEGCNRMDLVLVSSNHAKNVFEQIKFDMHDKVTNQITGHLVLTTRCKVLFEGVDLTKYFDTSNFKLLPIDIGLHNQITSMPEQFAFLFVGHWMQGELGQDRKDVGMLVHTFLNTFKDLPPITRPALVIKCAISNSVGENNSIKSRVENIIQSIRDNGWTNSLPSVYILNGDASDDDINAIYNHPKIKAMVSFTKGEGFGRPLLEFTTTGKPVIASNWSGQTDFLNTDHSFLLPGELKKVHPSACNDWIIPDSQWFTVNYAFAAQVLRGVFLEYDKHHNISKGHIEITKNNFSYDKMVADLGNILENKEAFAQKPKEHKIVIPKFKKELEDATHSS